MSERLEKLRNTLAELEAELRELDTLDDASRSLLAEVSDEIHEILSKNQASVHSTSQTWQSRLLEEAERFETAHPTLAGIVRRLVDGLGQMGI